MDTDCHRGFHLVVCTPVWCYCSAKQERHPAAELYRRNPLNKHHAVRCGVEKAHQKTWMGTALISIIFFIGGITLLISGEMTETYYATIIAVTIGSLVPILIIQGILAHKAAS
ncbi:hypothetical protein CIP101352_02341 [Corynebacterium diphtheriae]|nr:hypothetical protein CIP101352_02341 [Corynebacterium diphtheriae]